MIVDKELAYKRELQHNFHCQKCGQCCILPQRITLTKVDVERLAQHFCLTYDKAYLIFSKVEDGFLMMKHTLPCMFYEKGRGCLIYAARPKVCRDFPFLHQIGSGEIDMYECPAAEQAIAERIAKEHLRR